MSSVNSNINSELFNRSQKVAPGGVHSPVRAFKGVGGSPLFFKSAQGAYLTSVEDQKYVDFCMSFGPMILGHRDADVQNSVLEMINTAWSFGACEPYSLALGEWLQNEVPHLEKLRFVSSGTEAVMSALRVARGATKKNKILKFHGCYHGHVDNMLVKAGSGLAGEAVSDSAGVSAEVADSTIVVPLDNIQALEKAFAVHHVDLAAAIIEPLPANFGLLPQREVFLQALKDLCLKYNVLLIFDEVISGFRVSIGGMARILKIKPDLVTYGKILGGGFPVGCYGGRSDLMELVAPQGPVYQAGTLSANPVGMVAGLETLKKIKTNSVIQVINERTKNWTKKLSEAFQTEKIPISITQFGSLFWFYPNSILMNEPSKLSISSTSSLLSTPITKISNWNNGYPRSIEEFPKNTADVYKTFFHELLKRGIYLPPNAYEVGFMSYAHTDELLDSLIEKFVEAGRISAKI